MNTFENRNKLIQMTNPYDFSNTNDLFVSSLKETINHHIENNKFFSDLCKLKNFKVSDLNTVDDIVKIPPVHANFFKLYESLSIDRKDVVEHVTSSGTKGHKSQMFFDKDSWDFGQDMIKTEMSYFNFISNEPTNYTLYTYEPTQESKLGTAKTNVGLLQYAPVKEKYFALRHNGRNHDFDVYGAIHKFQEYEKDGAPVRIFGFPSFLYFTLKQMKDMNVPKIKLNKNSMTLFGGGWKGNADKQIPKKELYSLIEEMLSIPNENCRDGYGSTEHSVPYFECENHNFHVPIYSRVVIRDFKTLEPIGYEKEGLLNFITPHLLSVPAVSVLMGDKAVLHRAESCSCGINTPYIEILGRAGTSKTKSCAITASELLKR